MYFHVPLDVLASTNSGLPLNHGEVGEMKSRKYSDFSFLVFLKQQPVITQQLFCFSKYKRETETEK